MAAKSRLPVFSTLYLAVRFVAEGRQEFFNTAFLPVVVLTLLNTLGAGMALPIDPENPAAGFHPPAFIVAAALVAQLALYAMFAVAWHRRWLLPGESVTYATALKWDSRKTLFLLRLFLIFGAGIAVMLPLFALFQILGLGAAPEGDISLASIAAAVLTSLIAYTVMCRFMPLLPAAALDDPMNFRSAWALTSGATGQMFLITILPSLAFAAVNFVAELALDTVLSGIGLGGSLVAVALQSIALYFLLFFGLAVGVSALSIAYQSLKQSLPVPAD